MIARVTHLQNHVHGSQKARCQPTGFVNYCNLIPMPFFIRVNVQDRLRAGMNNPFGKRLFVSLVLTDPFTGGSLTSNRFLPFNAWFNSATPSSSGFVSVLAFINPGPR